MRTKTLLIAAAALAATVISSQAQVYSGVVGYVNVTAPANTLVLTANPLDNGTNDLNSLLGALPVKSTAQVWNGSGFTISTKGGSGWNPDPTLPPGTGFFIKSASAQTNTFVGNVVAQPGGGTVTNSLTANIIALVGSPLPYGTDLNDTNNTLNLNTLPVKSTAQVWNGSGFTISTKGGSGWNPDPTIPVAGGFFIKSSATTNWIQTLQ
jgi:hypothetical protein